METMLTKSMYGPIGERIWDARVSREYSRELLAERADISSRFLYDIEMGRKGFTVFVLCKLCDALDVTSSWIIYGADHDQQGDCRDF